MNILSWIGWITFIVGLPISIMFMRRVKLVVPVGTSSAEPLNQNEKLYVWILSLADPLVAQTIFYYGWRSGLPQKAKSANSIGWLAILIRLALGYFLSTL